MKIGPKILVPFVQWPNLWATERMNSSTEAASKTVELTSNGLPNSEYVKSVPKNEPTWHFFQMSIFPTKIRSEKNVGSQPWQKIGPGAAEPGWAPKRSLAIMAEPLFLRSSAGWVALDWSCWENLHRKTIEKKTSNIGLSWKFSHHPILWLWYKNHHRYYHCMYTIPSEHIRTPPPQLAASCTAPTSQRSWTRSLSWFCWPPPFQLLASALRWPDPMTERGFFLWFAHSKKTPCLYV